MEIAVGLVRWSLAVVAFLIWSLAAWLAFSLSDWLASLAAELVKPMLAPELGAWAQWLSTSLGDAIQVVVVIAWLAVGLAILMAPVWLKRLGGGPRYSPSGGAPDPYRDERDWRGDRETSRHRNYWREWSGPSRRELEDARRLAKDMVAKFKHRKKRNRDWDDD